MSETDATTEGFARRYRPRQFEDVVGQGSVVTFLANLIRRGKRRRDLLLYGSVGSGKTSLARIYGQALNCDVPKPSGSPCGSCASCAEQDGYFHEYDVPGRGGDLESIKSFLVTAISESSRDKVRVLFFDEAHRLDALASDMLLKRVEERDETTVYIFATTEVERIRPALASRLIGLEVLPLGVEDAVFLLKRVSDSEKIEIEMDALMMLAGLRQGYPRDLLTGLELAVDEEGGVITLDRVKEIFDIELDSLLAYVGAVARADVERQLQSIRLWRVSASQKIRWIQAVFTSLYYNEILGVRLIVDAAIDSIGDAERHRLIVAFERRLGKDRTHLRPAWNQLLQFWLRAAEVPADDATINLQVALFNELIAKLAGDPVSLSAAPIPEVDGQRSPTVRAAQQSALALRHTGSSDVDANHFTNAADVRTLFNSASFLVQEYGKFFDLSITFLPRYRGMPSVEDGAAMISQYCGELIERVRQALGEAVRVPLVRILEGEDSSIRGFVLASLASHQTSDDREALKAWADRSAAQYRESYDVSVTISPSTTRSSLRWHWEQLRTLCAGIDTAAVDTDPETGLSKPLYELIGLRRRQLRSAQPLRISRIYVSDEINAEAMASASDYGMQPLLAFDEKAWRVLATGWELQEHSERKRMMIRRKLEIRRTILKFGLGTPDQIEAETELRHLWGEDPRRRTRSRLGWWSA